MSALGRWNAELSRKPRVEKSYRLPTDISETSPINFRNSSAAWVETWVLHSFWNKSRWQIFVLCQQLFLLPQVWSEKCPLSQDRRDETEWIVCRPSGESKKRIEFRSDNVDPGINGSCPFSIWLLTEQEMEDGYRCRPVEHVEWIWTFSSTICWKVETQMRLSHVHSVKYEGLFCVSNTSYGLCSVYWGDWMKH